MTLINRGCWRAIRMGAEYLSRDLLEEVKTDDGSDSRRAEFEAAFSSGTLTTRITSRKPTPPRAAAARRGVRQGLKRAAPTKT